MRPFEELVTEADAADVTGWGFDWLNGRATEERTPWGYAKLLADRLGQVESALDVDTGGGEVLAESPNLPPRMVVTEAWPPNARRARELLEPRGVQVIDTVEDAALVFEPTSDRGATTDVPVADRLPAQDHRPGVGHISLPKPRQLPLQVTPSRSASAGATGV